ncbi:hypothetical protein [Silvibacterium sp.]|uniref:magnesium and cobalt transport protein CorA n=1 Tax=Silvibacterium sp. TaxID=1964179 RepID=UPI0039E2388A
MAAGGTAALATASPVPGGAPGAASGSTPGSASSSGQSEAQSAGALSPAIRQQLGRMSGVKKAAILVIAMGDELGKVVLQNLPEQDVQRLTEEIAQTRNVPPDLSAAVVEEFHEMLGTQHVMAQGGGARRGLPDGA